MLRWLGCGDHITRAAGPSGQRPSYDFDTYLYRFHPREVPEAVSVSQRSLTPHLAHTIYYTLITGGMDLI